MAIFRWEPPLTGVLNAGGVGRNLDSEPMPAVDTATGEVLQTWSPVDDSHHLAGYIAGHILRVFDHQAPHVIRSPSLWFLSARATKHTLALYTITIDRMYDSMYDVTPKTTEQDRIVCTSKSKLK